MSMLIEQLKGEDVPANTTSQVVGAFNQEAPLNAGWNGADVVRTWYVNLPDATKITYAEVWGGEQVQCYDSYWFKNEIPAVDVCDWIALTFGTL